MEKQNQQSDLFPDLLSYTSQTPSETEPKSTDQLIGEWTQSVLLRTSMLLSDTSTLGLTEKNLPKIRVSITSAMQQLALLSSLMHKLKER